MNQKIEDVENGGGSKSLGSDTKSNVGRKGIYDCHRDLDLG